MSKFRALVGDAVRLKFPATDAIRVVVRAAARDGQSSATGNGAVAATDKARSGGLRQTPAVKRRGV